MILNIDPDFQISSISATVQTIGTLPQTVSATVSNLATGILTQSAQYGINDLSSISSIFSNNSSESANVFAASSQSDNQNVSSLNSYFNQIDVNTPSSNPASNHFVSSNNLNDILSGFSGSVNTTSNENNSPIVINVNTTSSVKIPSYTNLTYNFTQTGRNAQAEALFNQQKIIAQ